MAPFDEAKFAELEQAHKQRIVVGLRKATGLLSRLDVDVLLHDHPDTFNLFLIALSELQNAPNDDPMGYFQIAGKQLPPPCWSGSLRIS